MFYVSSYTVFDTINTVLVAIFDFHTRVTGRRSRMTKCGKSCKGKGRERHEKINYKYGFQSRDED